MTYITQEQKKHTCVKWAVQHGGLINVTQILAILDKEEGSDGHTKLSNGAVAPLKNKLSKNKD